MANKFKFITSKVGDVYVGHPQHGKIYTKAQSYDFLSRKIGYAAPIIEGAFCSLRRVSKENLANAFETKWNGFARFLGTCRGAFATATGPWDRSVNRIVCSAVELSEYRDAMADVIPANATEGAQPRIDSLMDSVTQTFDEISGTDEFVIAGRDLAIDATKDDEYVCFVDTHGVERRAEILEGDLTSVVCRFAEALPDGRYTAKLCTRSGYGEEYGVRTASRGNIIVKNA